MDPSESSDDVFPVNGAGEADELTYAAGLKALVSDYLSFPCQRRIETAFLFAVKAHQGQTRESGEPYVTHPVAVAETLARWRLDTNTVIAALLHDVVEDTPVAKAEIVERFGQPVADLVDAVSKLDKVLFHNQEQAQAENLRKMLVAMVDDVRVILIKLADRQHNMETLGSMRPDKRRRIAKETLDIYAPIANRLGIHTLYQRLCDLSLRYRYPYRALAIDKALRSSRDNRREAVARILDNLQTRFSQEKIDCQIHGQEKSIYSIYHKMAEQKLTFSELLDIYSFRIIVGSLKDCYLALGVLHSIYKPMPGKIRDYIALPKSNSYQSLHTTVIAPTGSPIKIQICTQEMSRVAEAGIVSLWLYRDGDVSFADLSDQTEKWLQSIMEIETTSPDSSEFLENVKIELLPKQIYVVTPKGKMLTLPLNATPVDFAYAIHTTVGNHSVGCKVNHRPMPLRTVLKNGDRVEIITSPQGAPKSSWLVYVKTARARSEIRHYLKSFARDETIEIGRRLLSQIVRSQGLKLAKLDKSFEQLLAEFALETKDDLFLEIGLGKTNPAVIAQRLVPQTARMETSSRQNRSVLIRDADGVAIQLANCCHPIPGDPIIGSVHKARTLVVHALECPKAVKGRQIEPVKWIEADWDMNNITGFFDVTLRITASNRPGVLAKVATKIGDTGSNISYIHFEPTHGASAKMLFTLQVADRVHLAGVMRLIRKMPEVRHIQRVRFPKTVTSDNDDRTVEERAADRISSALSKDRLSV